MTCNKCHVPLRAVERSGTVIGLCLSCFDDMEAEARSRGFSLKNAPRRGEADERTLMGVKIFYWRDAWRTS